MSVQIGKVELPPFHNNPRIEKIDVSRGEDFWILTDKNELYHWSTILKKLLFMRNNVLDFSIGSDGTAVYINQNYEIYIRNLFVNQWFRIDDGGFNHRTISLCDYTTIFTTNDFSDFIKGVYDNETDAYNWEYVDKEQFYYHISCAHRDHSLWVKDHFNYVYKYINSNRRTPLTEIPFNHMKVLSEEYAIGIDYNSNLWKYISGTWVWVRSNVKCATVNYDGDLFFLDNNNNHRIYNIKSTKST